MFYETCSLCKFDFKILLNLFIMLNFNLAMSRFLQIAQFVKIEIE